MLLNLSDAPTDPLARLKWLTGVTAQAKRELETDLARTYYQARLEGRFEAAVKAGPVSRKRALAMTRAENNKRGRMVRWGDGN